MELSREHVVARDGRGERNAVVGSGNRHRGVVGNRIRRIDEIEVGVVRHAGEDSMSPRLAHAVPSDLRVLERAAVNRARIAHDTASDNAEAIDIALFAAIEQQLDADADAQEWFTGAGYVVAENFDESESAQIFHRGAGGTMEN